MAEEAKSIIKLEQGTARAIGSFLNGKKIRLPLHIDLNFSGCCDASLGLCLDDVRRDLKFCNQK